MNKTKNETENLKSNGEINPCNEYLYLEIKIENDGHNEMEV